MSPRTDLVIRVRGLSVGWPGVVLLEDVAFDVPRGRVFAILGDSGSGKSTLMRYLVGLEEAVTGEIDIDGRGPVDLDAGLPPFGVLFQAGALFGSMTTQDNVALPLEEWTDLPRAAISVIARAKLRLVGLEGAGSKPPSELSGGMRKRAAMARALALDPKLVFLDEPSSGLDPVTAAGIDALVLTLKESMGLSVVVVTHELDSIFRIADTCILLSREEKRIIASGDPRALRGSRDPRVRAFFGRRAPRELARFGEVDAWQEP